MHFVISVIHHRLALLYSFPNNLEKSEAKVFKTIKSACTYTREIKRANSSGVRGKILDFFRLQKSSTYDK